MLKSILLAPCRACLRLPYNDVCSSRSRGFESMQEVYDICRRGQYKPWVVPGGLLSPPFVVLGTSHDAKDLLTKNVHKVSQRR